MDWLLGLFIFFGLLAVLSLSWRVSARLRNWLKTQVDDTKKDVRKSMSKGIGWLLIPAFKYAVKGSDAPPGSWKWIAWQVFLVAAVAYGIWLVLGLIDKRINGQDVKAPEDYVV